MNKISEKDVEIIMTTPFSHVAEIKKDMVELYNKGFTHYCTMGVFSIFIKDQQKVKQEKDKK